jgi:uncharacterized protein
MTMKPTEQKALAALQSVLQDIGEVAVAVSGGVDSMTLATVAARFAPATTRMYHAVSAAVPAEATRRVRALAATEGWQLHLIDAGELDSPAYVENPVNRCLYCKQALYSTIRHHTTRQIVSGANLDDLDDYRPGLQAAADAGVRHPFVEAGIDKAAVRAIARLLGLTEVSDLPASPCLSSRVQTGIRISAPMLRGIDEAERLVRAHIDARDIRCRVRREGIVVEVDAESLARLSDDLRNTVGELVSQSLSASRSMAPAAVTFEPYRVGSAFIRVSQ